MAATSKPHPSSDAMRPGAGGVGVGGRINAAPALAQARSAGRRAPREFFASIGLAPRGTSTSCSSYPPTGRSFSIWRRWGAEPIELGSAIVAINFLPCRMATTRRSVRGGFDDQPALAGFQQDQIGLSEMAQPFVGNVFECRESLIEECLGLRGIAEEQVAMGEEIRHGRPQRAAGAMATLRSRAAESLSRSSPPTEPRPASPGRRPFDNIAPPRPKETHPARPAIVRRRKRDWLRTPCRPVTRGSFRRSGLVRALIANFSAIA